MSRRIALLIAVALTALQATAQMGKTVDQYIEQFKDLAIGEMDRSGIPASITLAQGILESSYGNSSLAKEANNHFGIKCHSTWEGETYYIKDDDKDKHGKLIESCFRSYPSAYESYFDHTDFLSRKGRYSFLFDYPNTDYISWAKGLKKAGYATNPKYADLLIKVIEKNLLNQYDYMTNEVLVYEKPAPKKEIYVTNPVTTRSKTKVAVATPEVHEELEAMASIFPAPYKSGVFYINQVKTVSAKVGDTPASIAKKNNVSHKRLLEYNDLKNGDKLIPNQYVFLQPKRKKSRERRTYHKAKEGETIYVVAQLYGLQLEELTTRNLMRANEEPKAGSRIYLNKEPRVKPVVYVPSEQPMTKPKITPAQQKASDTMVASKPAEKTIRPATSTATRTTSATLPQTERERAEAAYNARMKAAKVATSSPAPKPTPRPSTRTTTTTAKPKTTGEKRYSAVTTRTANPNAIKDIEDQIVRPKPEHTATKTANTVAHTPSPVPAPIVPMTDGRKTWTNNRQVGTQNPASSTSTLNPAVVSPSASSVEIAAVTVSTSNGPGPSAPAIKVKEYKPTTSKPTETATTNATVVTDHRKHVVRKGDTLYNLSIRYKMPIQELRFKNGIDANEIQVGQELVVN